MRILAIAALFAASSASAGEGTAQLGASQVLRASLTELRVDVLANGETITWSGTSDDGAGGSRAVSCDVYDPTGAALVGHVPDGGQVVANSGKGAYLLECGEDFRGSDACCDPTDLANFDPVCCATPDGEVEDLVSWDVGVVGAPADRGRVWSSEWWFDAGTYGAGGALDGSFFVLVDGGSPANDGVVELKVDGLAGFLYTVGSNGIGVVGADGRSVPDDGIARFDETYPVYLQPPETADFDALAPSISNATLTLENPQCGGVSPGDAGDGAVFTFTSGASGTWHLTCDLDHDGELRYADDLDLHRLGAAVAGVNTVTWDGLDNRGVPLPAGTYDCRIDVTVGEMHYPARDVETAYQGIRLFAVDAALGRTGLPMWWNDTDVQANEDDPMPNGEISAVRSPPFGLDPGLYTDPPEPSSADTVGNSRAWGDFDSTSKGNNAWLDTWSFLAVAEGPTETVVILDDTDTDGDGVLDATEVCDDGTDPADADSDDDGLDDGVEKDLGYDALDGDMDGDGLDDGVETPGGVPQDTDGDGLDDAQDGDDDDDGIATIAEIDADSDGDGLPNYQDDDDDGDGVPTLVEGPTANADTDGIVNYLDADDDNDGILTRAEDVDGNGTSANDDIDGDQLPDYLDVDDDGDTVKTADELGIPNVDGDALPAWLDADDDGDGVLTADEDVDGNGDATDDDSDADGTPDWLDDDDDGDGILTRKEDWDGSGDPADDDLDGDGIADYADLDDDGDGLPSLDEDTDPADGDLQDDDHDHDGAPDFRDPDDDGDGLPSLLESGDFDGDGTPDVYDADDDDDGLPTLIEGQGDGDGDGFGNWHDADSDADGLPDGLEGTSDTDSDGQKDFEDPDDDGDHVDTLDEVDGDSDGDGLPDRLDPDDDADGLLTIDEGANDPDGDGLPSYLDDDSDADGLLDADEGAEDVDHDGTGNFEDTDSDADTFADGEEGLADTDGDGLGDFLDPDDDGDTVASADEPGDTDGDGAPDRIDADDDGDGIPTSTEAADDALWGGALDDGDDLPAWRDTDSDGDGLLDADEGTTSDGDGDGAPDYLDPDILGSWYKGGGACTTTGGPPVGMLATILATLALRRRRTVAVGAAVLGLAGAAKAAGDGPEISRSRGTHGGALVLWPRVVATSPDPAVEDLAGKLQARLQQIAGRVLPPEKVMVRPEPERACPMDGGCRAVSLGVLLGADQGGCVAVVWVTPPGDEGATTLVPWGGKVDVGAGSLQFRQPPESAVSVLEYERCGELLTRLDDAAVEQALRAAVTPSDGG